MSMQGKQLEEGLKATLTSGAETGEVMSEGRLLRPPRHMLTAILLLFWEPLIGLFRLILFHRGLHICTTFIERGTGAVVEA